MTDPKGFGSVVSASPNLRSLTLDFLEEVKADLGRSLVSSLQNLEAKQKSRKVRKLGADRHLGIGGGGGPPKASRSPPAINFFCAPERRGRETVS